MLAKEATKLEEITDVNFVFEEYISMIKERNLEKWKSADYFFVSLFQHLENWRGISSVFRRYDVSNEIR